MNDKDHNNRTDAADSNASGITAFETLIDQARQIEAGDDELQDWLQLDLGRFQLLRLLGRGGMGMVFLAHQHQPVERQVALKLIRRRVRNSESLARFDVERQALARMQHPHIAQVYDAGTTSEGHPWFAMEYVDGVALDHYCREQRLNLEQRLRLFVRICRGVEHAHQKGMIHRDLKPANILVTEVDGLPLPKIIDFGIATSSDSEGNRSASNRVGTPHYMSPEQFAEAEAGIDTRSDVYSLGVILFELLIDQPPIPRSSFTTYRTQDELASLFHAGPRRPSTLLTESGAGADDIAHRRRTSPRRLRRQLRNDLDSIVMRALAPVPDQRYSTAGELAADIERSMRHEPVVAMPAKAGYQARKFIRRHALALGSASAILLALVVGLAAATMGMIEAQRQFQIAEQRQQELELVTRFQQAMLQEVDPQAMGEGMLEAFSQQWQSGLEREGRDRQIAQQALAEAQQHVNTTDLARQILSSFVLERATESVEREFVGQPTLQAQLYESIFAVYRAIDFRAALPELAAKILRLRTELFGGQAATTLEASLDLAWAYYLTNDLNQAETRLLAILEQLDPSQTEQRPLLIRASNDLATVQVDQGQLQQALERVRENVSRAAAWLGPDDETTIQTTSIAGFVHARAGDVEQALEYFEQALAAMRRTLEPDNPRIGRALLNIASALGQLGRHAEALEIDQQIVDFFSATRGRRSSDTLRAMSNMANNLAALQRGEEAIRLLVETSELATEALGPNNPQTLRTRLNLGSILARQGRREEGQIILEDVAERRLALFGPDHPETLSAQEVLGNIMLDRGAAEAALPLLQTVMERRSALFGPDHAQTIRANYLFGRALLDTGQAGAAEVKMEQVTLHYQEQLGPQHRLTLDSALHWYRAQIALDRRDEAARVRADHLAPLTADGAVNGDHPELVRRLAEIDQQH